MLCFVPEVRSRALLSWLQRFSFSVLRACRALSCCSVAVFCFASGVFTERFPQSRYGGRPVVVVGLPVSQWRTSVGGVPSPFFSYLPHVFLFLVRFCLDAEERCCRKPRKGGRGCRCCLCAGIFFFFNFSNLLALVSAKRGFW